MTGCDLLFVYGTLRRVSRSRMHGVFLKSAEFIGKGGYQGRLYLISDYPGVVPSDDPDDIVKGEVYKLRDPDRTLRDLDRYEECGDEFPQPTEYLRQVQDISLFDGRTCRAWVYIYNRPTDTLQPVHSGDYADVDSGIRHTQLQRI